MAGFATPILVGMYYVCTLNYMYMQVKGQRSKNRPKVKQFFFNFGCLQLNKQTIQLSEDLLKVGGGGGGGTFIIEVKGGTHILQITKEEVCPFPHLC